MYYKMPKKTKEIIKCDICGKTLTKKQLDWEESDEICSCEVYNQIETLKRQIKKLKQEISYLKESKC